MGWQTRFSADGRKAEGFVNDAASVHAYDGMARLANDGFAPSDSDMQLLGDVDLLGQGKQAMAITDNTLAIASLKAQNMRYGAAPPAAKRGGDER